MAKGTDHEHQVDEGKHRGSGPHDGSHGKEGNQPRGDKGSERDNSFEGAKKSNTSAAQPQRREDGEQNEERHTKQREGRPENKDNRQTEPSGSSGV